MSRNFELLQRALHERHSAPFPREAEVSRATPPLLKGNSALPRTAVTDWQRCLEILNKHWRLSSLVAVAVIATVICVTFLMKPVYEPDARVQVDPPGAEAFSLNGNNNGSASADYLETQAQNLQSDELAVEVIRKLHLDQNPDFAGTASAATSSASSGQLTAAENAALIAFKNARRVTRDSASRLITVSVAAHDPVTAQSATNTLVDGFIERDYRLRHAAILESSRWLQRQLDDIRKRMDDSNRALINFQKTTGAGADGANQSAFSEQMIDLSKQLTQVQTDRIQLQSYLNELSGRSAASLPQISNDPIIQELTKKLAGVRTEIAQARAIYGPNHPNLRKLQNEEDELQSQITQQRTAIMNDLRAGYTTAHTRERLMENQLQNASKQMVLLSEYNTLKRDADSNTQLYNALYQKIKEADIAAESKSSNIRMVDRARVLPYPTRPHRRQNIGLGLLAGVFCGIVFAFLREAADTRIRTPEDIKTCLGTELVSVVPIIGRNERNTLLRPSLKLLTNKSDVTSSAFVIERPNSPEAEALRGIYTSMRLSSSNGGSPPQVLLIASPTPGEGKTMLAINLAIALAQHGSTCLVDGDLRKQGVAPALGISSTHGLSDLLAGSAVLDQAIVGAIQVPSLSVLTAGNDSADPGILIASRSMTTLIDELRQRFEFVVIDSPPILPFADGRALSALVDGIVMVGRSGMTTRHDLRRAMELLQKVRSAPVLEVVLNGADYPTADYHRYYRS